ncbi:MAG: polysaccharide deacetylase family protein [Burkholderiales bacterium]|nr:polysaccharide deacetylase family protein [Burkholderiales bacterium]
MIVRGLAHALSRGGAQARLSVLIFHRVLPEVDPLFPSEPDVRRFDQIVGWVSRWFEVLPLETALRQLHDGALPARAAAITFDDGYADNATHALPILLRHGVSATFFVATGFADGSCMWNDVIIDAIRRTTQPALDLHTLGVGRLVLTTLAQRRAAIDTLLAHIKYLAPAQRQSALAQVAEQAAVALPSDLMMHTAQWKTLRNAGMQIGAHTVSHPILERISDDEAQREIATSKRTLEAELDVAVNLFAYPNGKSGKDFAQRHVQMVRAAGFTGAVSTDAGVATPLCDPHQVPRFTPWDRQRSRFALRMLANLRHPAPAMPG